MNHSFHRAAPVYFGPLFLVLTAFSVSVAGAATYTFDNLNPGLLAGQDNWMTLNANNSSYVVSTGTGFDTTRVAGNPGTDNGSGMDVHINGRTNDGNFTFGNLTGATGLTLSFDTQVQNNAGQQQFINFGLAAADFTHGSPGFAYFQYFGGQPEWALGSSAGGTSGNIPGSFATGDWIRLAFVMDFTANGGQGFGDLYYTNLTQGGVPQLLASNFNLGNPSVNTSFWNTMWSRSDFDSSVIFDNLTVTPTFTAVPEVRSAWIAVACALLIGIRLMKRRRRPIVVT
jgi:hypothetical protein